MIPEQAALVIQHLKRIADALEAHPPCVNCISEPRMTGEQVCRTCADRIAPWE